MITVDFSSFADLVKHVGATALDMTPREIRDAAKAAAKAARAAKMFASTGKP